MTTLPKSVRFKKISKSETVFVQGGLVSNRHWIISAAWLATLKRRRDLGMTALCKRVEKAQAAATLARLNDSSYPTHDLGAIVASFDLSEYRSAKALEFHYGFIRGKADQYDACIVSFGVKGTPYLDVEYAAALYFSTDTAILVKDSKSPVLLQDASGAIVAVLAPLNPDKIKEHLKGK